MPPAPWTAEQLERRISDIITNLSQAEIKLLTSHIDVNCLTVQFVKIGFSSVTKLGSEKLVLAYLALAKDFIVDPFWGFDEAFYRTKNLDVATAISTGEFYSGFHHWVMYGQSERRLISDPAKHHANKHEIRVVRHKLKYKLFDQKYYLTEIAGFDLDLSRGTAIEHFIKNGLMKGVVPTLDFDEEFYIAYYADVSAAKTSGHIPSGYYHYLLSGELEGRLPKHDSATAVRNKLGSLSVPVGIKNSEAIELRLRNIKTSVRSLPMRINVIIPAMDGDILFGGYIAFFHFLCRLVERGHRLRFIITEDGQSNKSWFLRCIAKRKRWVDSFAKQEFFNATVYSRPIPLGSSDFFISYSAWTTLDAIEMARGINSNRMAFFIQEYEPIFHQHDSFRFLVESAYRSPHLPIFNTEILRKYFFNNKIGFYADGRRESEGIFFQHALSAVRPATEEIYAADERQRRFAFYARPETHAGRNLYEIGFLALKLACKNGWIPRDWELVGLGSLGNQKRVELDSGYSITMMPRVDQDQYEAMLQSFDVGLSLMWAPHPSIIPFELAKAGCICVTNSFGARDERSLARYGSNIEVAEPTIRGVADAIGRAVKRSSDYRARIAAANFRWSDDWDVTFDSAFFDRLERDWGI